jgi:L-threonylcarbamoyladenylate synthase
MLDRHYAPRARVRLFESDDRARVVADAAAELSRDGRVGAMAFESLGLPDIHEHLMPPRHSEYARALYATLHALDDLDCDVIWIERPPATPEWAGILDRLVRAARS